jgi:outer membrane receptor protein involved in Fe transport
MSYFKWILSLWLCLHIVLCQGQTVVLTGQVTEASSRLPLPGAIIKIGDRGTTTDFDGNYTISVSDWPLYGQCTYVGFIPFAIDIEKYPGVDTFYLNIAMVEAENILATTTVTGGRYERNIAEATVSIEVIRPALIENTNTVAVDQVLQKMPGVDIIGGQPNIRGGSGFSYGAGTRVLLLQDNIPALQADAGFPNWNDFPVENIAQIEILKGAASVLYGSSALNGIINILTGYATEEPVTKASLYYTHYMSPNDKDKKWWDIPPYEVGGSFLHKQKLDKLDLILGGFFRKNESFNEATFDRYARANLNIRYRFTDRLSAGFNSNFNPGHSSDFFYWLDGAEGAHRASPGVINESRRFRFNIDPYATYFDKAGNQHKILSRFYYVDNNNSDNRSNQSNLLYSEYQFLRRLNAWDMVITAGAVAQGTSVRAELYGDTLYTSRNFAAYAQAEKTFFKSWTVSAGMRIENNIQFSPEQIGNFIIEGGRVQETKPVFRFGSNWQMLDYTYLRASYGQGYRYPTVAERFIDTPLGPVSIFPNPVLESETGWSSEIGIKQGLKWGRWAGFFDLAWFVQEYDNMMEFVATIDDQFNFGFQSQNIGDTRISGFDMNLNGAGHLGGFYTTLLTGYTYLNPKYRNFTEMDSLSSSAKRNILKYRFQHTFKLDIETGRGKWRAGIAVQYYSNMDNIDAILEDLVVPGLKTWRADNNSGFTLIDLRGSWEIIKPLKVSLIARNIGNREYSLRPGLLEAPTNITLRLDYDFRTQRTGRR